MKARFPLATKIVLLALVNLLALAAVFVVFARVQLHVEFGSFLFSAAEDRVLAAARLLALDLADTPESGREDLLRRYARTYGVNFYLFEDGGTQAGGQPVHLPQTVEQELRRPPPRREGSPPPRRHRKEDQRDDDRPNNGQRPPRGHGPPPDGAPQHPIFQVATADPKLYWVGVRIPLRERDGDEGRPGTVLMTSPTFFGTPLFFDYKPWATATGTVIAIFVLCWLPLIRGLSRSISQITRVTGQIAEGHFDERLSEARNDELGRLAAAINAMATRLSGFVTGQKRFLGDIAHELCSPIARIQFSVGILEQRAAEDQKTAVQDLQDEVGQMSVLVGELLQFSKAGIQPQQKTLRPVDVKPILEEAAAREAGEAEVRVTADADLWAMADADDLRRAVSNLVRNAVRYAGSAGPVLVTARREGADAVIAVADSGPGLPESELERVFTPFYRAEASRNRSSGGVGLGLAIVKSCVEACRGSVQCRNRVPNGLTVEIRLRAK